MDSLNKVIKPIKTLDIFPSMGQKVDLNRYTFLWMASLSKSKDKKEGLKSDRLNGVYPWPQIGPLGQFVSSLVKYYFMISGI